MHSQVEIFCQAVELLRKDHPEIAIVEGKSETGFPYYLIHPHATADSALCVKLRPETFTFGIYFSDHSTLGGSSFTPFPFDLAQSADDTSKRLSDHLSEYLQRV